MVSPRLQRDWRKKKAIVADLLRSEVREYRAREGLTISTSAGDRHLGVEPRPLRPDQTHGFSRLTDLPTFAFVSSQTLTTTYLSWASSPFHGSSHQAIPHFQSHSSSLSRMSTRTSIELKETSSSYTVPQDLSLNLDPVRSSATWLVPKLSIHVFVPAPPGVWRIPHFRMIIG